MPDAKALPRFPENLLTDCETTFPALEGTTGKHLATTLLAFQQLYSECAIRHNILTDEIRKLQND